MFDNVGRSSDRNPGRRLSALVLSFLLNGSVAGGLIWAGSRVVEEVTEEEDQIEVAVALVAPPPPPPPPPPGGSKPKKEKKPDEVKPQEDVPVEPTPLDEPQSDKVVEADDGGVEGGVEGGVKDGVVGGVIGGVKDGVLGGDINSVAPKVVHWSEVEVKKRVNPPFPEAAKQLGLKEESCVVRIFIDPTGTPSRVEPRKCSELFRDAAVNAGMQWRFYPLKEGGRAISAQFDINFVFRLK